MRYILQLLWQSAFDRLYEKGQVSIFRDEYNNERVLIIQYTKMLSRAFTAFVFWKVLIERLSLPVGIIAEVDTYNNGINILFLSCCAFENSIQRCTAFKYHGVRLIIYRQCGFFFISLDAKCFPESYWEYFIHIDFNEISSISSDL